MINDSLSLRTFCELFRAVIPKVGGANHSGARNIESGVFKNLWECSKTELQTDEFV
jgi:hypothetical protein